MRGATLRDLASKDLSLQAVWVGFLLFLVCAATAWSQTDPPADAEAAETARDVAAQGGVGQLKIELEPSEITVGDRVEATLTLVWMGAEPSEPPRFPTWQETWGQSEVLEHGPIDSSVDGSGRRIYRQRLSLTSFEVGEVELPSTTVVIPLGDHNAEVSSQDDLKFQVISVLPETSEAEGEGDEAANGEAAEALEPRPAAAPRPLAGQESFLWTIAALSLLVLAAASLFFRRARQAAMVEHPEAPPWMPPLDALLSHLSSVDPEAGSEGVHTAISLALRRYLDRRLSWNAVGSTTSEIQRRLRTTRVTPPVIRALVTQLKECDQVKFARQEVSPSVNADRLARAREMGRSLEALLQPPAIVTQPTAAGPQTPPPPPSTRTNPNYQPFEARQ